MVLGNSVALTHSGANSLSVAGSTLSLGSYTLTDTASTAGTTGTISATISGTGGLTKSGPGTLSLTADNGYQGTTSVTAGLLLVNNPGSGSGTGTGPVAVSGTGTLGGTGNLAGSITATGSGTVAPGSPISGTTVLDTGAVSFTSGTTFQAQVNGNTPGAGHDQLNVTGAVVLNGATLSVSGTIASSPSQVVVLISNDGGEAVTGTFNALAEGASLTVGSVTFVISYHGGVGGNDVVLIEPGPVVTPGTPDAGRVRTAAGDRRGLRPAAIAGRRRGGRVAAGHGGQQLDDQRGRAGRTRCWSTTATRAGSSTRRCSSTARTRPCRPAPTIRWPSRAAPSRRWSTTSPCPRRAPRRKAPSPTTRPPWAAT